MSRDKRMKASDVFRESEFLFAQKTTFDEAFPQIAEVSVEVTQTGRGVSQVLSKLTYTKQSLGEFINCSNPLCYNGGFSIGSILREMVRNKQSDLSTTRSCQGYEGSAKGRSRWGPCMNCFSVRVHIDYRH